MSAPTKYAIAAIAVVATLMLALPAMGASSPISVAKKALKAAKKADRTAKRANHRATTALNKAGPQGDRGPAGPQGTPGAAGPQGSQGAAGADGAAGATGPTGAQGDTGATGAQGDTGPTGATGAAGSALAYAHVVSGALDTSRSLNVDSGDVTHPETGVYCFDSLGFTPKSAVLSLDHNGSSAGAENPGVFVRLTPDTPISGCAAGTQVSILILKADALGTKLDQNFDVTFN